MKEYTMTWEYQAWNVWWDVCRHSF